MALDGKKGLIVGIANDHSIAYGCAEDRRMARLELACIASAPVIKSSSSDVISLCRACRAFSRNPASFLLTLSCADSMAVKRAAFSLAMDSTAASVSSAKTYSAISFSSRGRGGRL